METIQHFFQQDWNIETFYPTYEEWKLSFSSNLLAPFLTFYPTYEEWKLRIFARCS